MKILKAFNLKNAIYHNQSEGNILLVINRILGLLEDGNWLDFKVVAEKSELTESEAGAILDFLTKFRFVELDEKRRRVKVTSPVLRFLQKIRQIER